MLDPRVPPCTDLSDPARPALARDFSVQRVARATYREILGRRAKENNVDFIDASNTAN
jgi:hypothetical protein